MIQNNYIKYLQELRQRLIRIVISLGILFLSLFLISERLYDELAKPLLMHLPEGSRLIATAVTSTFTVPTKLAFMAALFLNMPYIFYELWSFVAPALYKKEKMHILALVCASLIFFYIGTVFSYLILCPLALAFFAKAAPKAVTIMTDISNYLDFVLRVIFAGGLAFQVPVITFIAVEKQWLAVEDIKRVRPFVIVGAFTLGMLLTPPDVISQILLALPMWSLFEVGVVVVHLYYKKTALQKNIS